MRPAFAADPLANALFGCTVAVWVISEVLQSLRRRSNAANNDRYSLLFLRACIGVGVLFALLALRVPAAAFGYTTWLFVVGLLVMLAGIGLRWWSFWALGRYFTFVVMTSADQPVITSGAYRFLRHPSYTGALLALVGVGVCFGNWLSVIALLALPMIGFVYRMHVEEAALSAALGARYSAYARSRNRIIPFIW